MNKRYMRIGEVAKITGLSPRVIRQWEREFPMIKPLKKKGLRLYDEELVKLILSIKELYEKGLTREGIIRRLSPELTEEEMGFLNVLRGIKAELKEMLDVLDSSEDQGAEESI